MAENVGSYFLDFCWFVKFLRIYPAKLSTEMSHFGLTFLAPSACGMFYTVGVPKVP